LADVQKIKGIDFEITEDGIKTIDNTVSTEERAAFF